MSGYVEAGYAVVTATLSLYAGFSLKRQHSVEARLRELGAARERP